MSIPLEIHWNYLEDQVVEFAWSCPFFIIRHPNFPVPMRENSPPCSYEARPTHEVSTQDRESEAQRPAEEEPDRIF